MPVTTDQPAPYAPASAILELIERHRNRGLPPVVDSDVLLRAGISDSLVPRTLQALKSLDLLTEDGKPSEVLEGIRLAPSAEYQQRLTEWLNSAYADALSYIDPATDDEVKIRDAFRKYIPTGQQARMVTLFIGLFTAAGVMQPRARQPVKKEVSPAPRVRPKVVSATGHARGSSTATAEGRALFTGVIAPPGLPPALTGLLASLPIDGQGWPQERRDKFVATFEAVIDFCFPIVAEAKVTMLDEDDG